MYKFVNGALVFLMILGMIVSAVERAGANDAKFDEVTFESTIKLSDDRNDTPKIQLLSVEKTDETQTTEPILLVAEIQETTPDNDSEEFVNNDNIYVEPEVTQPEEKTGYHTGILTARKGYITDSPCGPNGNDGYETWYPTHPGGAVKILAKQCGFTNLKMEVCQEEGPRNGVRIISGTMPNGETFEDLVVVAADIKCESNPNGAFERGQLIETSLGPGIIVDYCERAVNERRYNGRTHIDIATNWYN